MKKKFLAVWGDWESAIHKYTPDTRFINGESFYRDNGYDKEDLQSIRSLEVGIAYHHPYGNHYILRLV